MKTKKKRKKYNLIKNIVRKVIMCLHSVQNKETSHY